MALGCTFHVGLKYSCGTVGCTSYVGLYKCTLRFDEKLRRPKAPPQVAQLHISNLKCPVMSIIIIITILTIIIITILIIIIIIIIIFIIITISPLSLCKSRSPNSNFDFESQRSRNVEQLYTIICFKSNLKSVQCSWT